MYLTLAMPSWFLHGLRIWTRKHQLLAQPKLCACAWAKGLFIRRQAWRRRGAPEVLGATVALVVNPKHQSRCLVLRDPLQVPPG